MDSNTQFLMMLAAVVLLGLYGLANRSAVPGRFDAAFPRDAARLFVPFAIAVVILWGANIVTGGALSGPFDRFWVGVAVGLTLGMVIAAFAMRQRVEPRRDRPR